MEPRWDDRLMERLARQSWEAANNPTIRTNPSFRAQIRSPYYWLAVLAFGGAVVLWLVADPRWLRALAAILYIGSLLATSLSRRDARAKDLRRSAVGEQ